jgi:Lantibiotic dehydratase, N terminus
MTATATAASAEPWAAALPSASPPASETETGAGAGAGRWIIADPVVLRRAGFPFAWLDELAWPAAAGAAEALAGADRARTPDRREDFRTEYERGCAEAGAAVLSRFRAEPGLRDMLLVSNDAAHDRLVRWMAAVTDPGSGWRKADRSKLDTLVRYLQRGCAKNDTTSHFGPLAVGRFDRSAASAVSWAEQPMRRRVGLSHWAAQVLLEQLAASARAPVAGRPRRSPGAVLRDRELTVVEFDYTCRSGDIREAVRVRPPVVLSPHLALLFELCDGRRSAADMAAQLAGEEDSIRSDLAGLAEIGAVVPGPELCYGGHDHLSQITEALDGAAEPARHAAALRAFDRVLQRLAQSSAEERPAALTGLKDLFTAVTGKAAERGPGAFYADRSVFNELCDGGITRIQVGPRIARAAEEDLGAVYDLFLLRSRLRFAAEHRLLAHWFRERFGAQAEVPLDRYLAAYLTDLDSPELQTGYVRIEADLDATAAAVERELLPPETDGAAAWRLEPGQVAEVLRRHGPAAEPALCDPDLMIAATDAAALERGAFQLVVGDLHATEENLSHGLFAPFLAAADPGLAARLTGHYRDLMRPDEELADVTQLHGNMTFARLPLGAIDIEACDRSPRGRDRVRTLMELTVRADGDRLRLRDPRSGFLRLVGAPLAWLRPTRNPFSVFAFPARSGEPALAGMGRAHLPRVQVGNVVVQRETWRIPAGRLAAKDKAAGFLRLQEVRAQLALPRRVYARCPGEPKPVFCDLDSPLLVRQLTRMATGAAPAEPVVLSEMFPDPSGLWLADRDGAYTAELRFAAFSTGRKR